MLNFEDYNQEREYRLHFALMDIVDMIDEYGYECIIDLIDNYHTRKALDFDEE